MENPKMPPAVVNYRWPNRQQLTTVEVPLTSVKKISAVCNLVSSHFGLFFTCNFK